MEIVPFDNKILSSPIGNSCEIGGKIIIFLKWNIIVRILRGCSFIAFTLKC